MRRITELRKALLDLGSLGLGFFLAVYLPVTRQLEAWHLPLIIALIFGPAVARENIVGFGLFLSWLGRLLSAIGKDDPPEPQP